jgi:hypothetical protein
MSVADDVTEEANATTDGPMQPAARSDYAPGVCNIGSAEIAARRRFGHLGLAVTVAFAAFVLAIDAPLWLRLLVFFPAAGAATGYLQAAFHFCAGFAMRGVCNFGPLGEIDGVREDAARAADRRRATEVFGLSVLIGAAAAGLLALL